MTPIAVVVYWLWWWHYEFLPAMNHHHAAIPIICIYRLYKNTDGWWWWKTMIESSQQAALFHPSTNPAAVLLFRINIFYVRCANLASIHPSSTFPGPPSFFDDHVHLVRQPPLYKHTHFFHSIQFFFYFLNMGDVDVYIKKFVHFNLFLKIRKEGASHMTKSSDLLLLMQGNLAKFGEQTLPFRINQNSGQGSSNWKCAKLMSQRQSPSHQSINFPTKIFRKPKETLIFYLIQQHSFKKFDYWQQNEVSNVLVGTSCHRWFF